MIDRLVVNYADNDMYRRGQARLADAIGRLMIPTNFPWFMANWGGFDWRIPADWPTHRDTPYAFKAFAMQHARERAKLLLWADSSILPIRSLEPLWERIERDGYWMSLNGWNNYEWTADSAYPDLFPGIPLDKARAVNRNVSHLVATTFGINAEHPRGKEFLNEYFRLANTNAFKGPWKNTPETPCGPPDVLGHRHDQTALSLIAWRLGMTPTYPPDIFAYAKLREDGTFHVEDQDPRTILCALGDFNLG